MAAAARAVVGRFVRIFLASRAHAEAIEVAAQWVATAPFNESAYQRLMQAQLLQDGRASALRIYEQCCVVLERELGIEPDAETQTLAQHIRQEVDIGTANLDAVPTVAEPTLTPFVGRQQEVQQLITRFHKVKQGQSQLLIIAGDAGMGKTQLVQTFLNWVTLDSPQADILLGRAYEMGGHLPYQPITPALRERVDAENAQMIY